MPLSTHNILSFVLIIATFTSTLRMPHWWIRGLDALCFQITVLMVIVLAWGLLIWDYDQPSNLILFLSLVFSILYNAQKIIPFTFLYPKEVKKVTAYKDKIRLLACNVRTKNKSYERLITLIQQQNPDIILLTETDKNWLDAIQKIGKNYPYQCLQPQENTYGMALYSKYELKDTNIQFLVEKDIPSIHTNIEISDKKLIQFIGLHPRPPAPWTEEENKDLELIYAAGTTNWNSLPSIVSGDLNDVGWSPATEQFKQISGLRDPRVGRGLFATYNAFIPFFRVPIDHFFVSHHFGLLSIKKLSKIGSDHFPVLLEVGIN